jgi:deazaflavin-dependent oxidoreductase (nitroreductase family)
MTTLNRGPRFFPAWVGRWQSKYLNPVVRRAAPYLPSFAVIEHRGRKSGKSYETPVNVFRIDNTLGIILGHGVTDWARNILAAGGAEVRQGRRTIRLTNPRVVSGDDRPKLPLFARLETGFVAATTGRQLQLFVADIATD